MTDAALQARREYRREWQRANRDRVKQYQERYWEKRAAQAAGRQEAPKHD